MSIFEHFIYTAQYQVLEVKPISNAVNMVWNSSVTPTSGFFQSSTAYQQLFD